MSTSTAGRRLLFKSERDGFFKLLSGAAVVQAIGMSYMGYVAATEIRKNSTASRDDKAPAWQRVGLATIFIGSGALGFGAMVLFARRSVRELSLSPCQRFLTIQTFGFGSVRSEMTVPRADCFMATSAAAKLRVGDVPPMINFRVIGHRGYYLLDTTKSTVMDLALIQRSLVAQRNEHA